jgi:sugar-specific transcriptional regulator TrmB
MQDMAIDTLVDLGLSVLQAKAYSTLATSGTLSGRAIARTAKVSPQDIYRILNELAEKGIVQKIISKPNKYCASPIDEGLRVLLKRRREKTEQLEKNAETIAKEAKVNQVTEEETNEFIIIPKREPIAKMTAKIFRNAQISIDLINDTEEILELHETNREFKTEAIQKGVRFRHIFGKKEKKQELSATFLRFAKKNDLIQIKTLDYPAPARLIIKDSKEVFFATTLKPGTSLQPFLWTNNAVMVQIVQQWFDNLWSMPNKAAKEKRINLSIRR